MTVCIAVGCDCYQKKNPKLILVADMMLSTWTTSADVGFKIRKLVDGWYVMFAAEDISGIDLVLGGAVSKLENEENVTESHVALSMMEAYQFVRRAFAQDLFLSPFGLDVKEFVRDRQVRDPQYSQLFSRIEDFNLGCDFLVGGFAQDGKEKPNIMHIRNPGILSPAEIVGFAAIGAGATNAFAYLARRDQSVFLSLEESLYNAIAAKNLAEKAIGVGQKTLVAVLEKGKADVEVLTQKQIGEIMQIWKQEERDFRPKNLKNRVSEIIAKKET